MTLTVRGTVTKRFSFITDLPLTDGNIKDMIACLKPTSPPTIRSQVHHLMVSLSLRIVTDAAAPFPLKNVPVHPTSRIAGLLQCLGGISIT
jgi:hypothetical protein